MLSVSHNAREAHFSPLNRGNVAAISFSIHSISVRIEFQSPQSGQCRCNSLLFLFYSTFGEFQSPQSGQCRCNVSRTIVMGIFRMIFQSPQSGQCRCNNLVWHAPRKRWRFQSPQSGQCRCNGIILCTSRAGLRHFSPLNRGNVAAI